MNKNVIAVVIPAYNEERVIGPVVAEVRLYGYMPIVVDDCSRDATAEVARNAGAEVLRHSRNRDQGAALETGTQYALRQGAEIIVHFDADGQHRIEDIPALIEPIINQNKDVVLGSRFLGSAENIRFERRIFLKGAILFTWLFSGIRLTDSHNGFRAFNRKAATVIRIRERHKAHASEILHEIVRHSLAYAEVPVTIRYTKYSLARGESSLRRTIGVLKRLFWKNLFH